MKKVIVRAPVRADLAGGTLDLWPLYLFHPGARTVNVAISYYAESEVVETGDNAIEIHLTDHQYRQRYESMQELAADPKAALIHRALEHFHLSGVHITTRTDAPRGSGLGGSSALTITLVRALSELTGAPLEREILINTVRDIETRLLGVPAGIQDYYPPVFGGLAALHLVPGAPIHRALGTPVADLARHFVLHYTGVAHFSGTNNWEMYKRQIEGKKKVQRGLAKIAANSIDMERALDAGDFAKAGKVLAREWASRKALIDGISTPEIDAAIDVALGAGAWGGKVCGAGGGGCVVFLTPPDKRDEVIHALGTVPGRVLDVEPVAHGLMIQRGDEAQAASSLTRPRYTAVRNGETYEQLYVHGGTGEYRPHVLAEAIVTLDEPRSGARQVVSRAYLGRIDDPEAGVVWRGARTISAESLDVRATPDPARTIDRRRSTESLAAGARNSVDSFKQFLGESERMRIFHNPAFALFSEPNESREAFLARCREEATRRLDDESERLESTFRRRIDQLRERSEREERVHEVTEGGEEIVAPGVSVAWGQTIYNITSGRPAGLTEAPQTARDTDYLDNIAQIQKAWDRELLARREALDKQAGEIEEVVATPTDRSIEITRWVILWAGNQF